MSDEPIIYGFLSDEEHAESIKDWPEHMRRIAEKWPSNTCYRSTVDPSYHFTIHDYARDRITAEISVQVLHGSGHEKTGLYHYIDPAQLVRCGCGKWGWPTEREKRAKLEEINIVRAARGLAPLPWQEESE